MKYILSKRQHDFDLFLYDDKQNMVFYTTKTLLNSVYLSTFDDSFERYLSFQQSESTVSIRLELLVQDHFDLLMELGLFND